MFEAPSRRIVPATERMFMSILAPTLLLLVPVLLVLVVLAQGMRNVQGGEPQLRPVPLRVTLRDR